MAEGHGPTTRQGIVVEMHGPTMRKCIMAEVHREAKLLPSWQPERRKKQKAGLSKPFSWHRSSDLTSFHEAPKLYLLKVPLPSNSTIGYGATL